MQPGEPVAENLHGGFCEGGQAQEDTTQGLSLPTESLDKKKHAQDIERDKKLAVDMDLYNTPTFFINGRKVIGERPFEYFKKIIDEEIRK